MFKRKQISVLPLLVAFAFLALACNPKQSSKPRERQPTVEPIPGPKNPEPLTLESKEQVIPASKVLVVYLHGYKEQAKVSHLTKKKLQEEWKNKEFVVDWDKIVVFEPRGDFEDGWFSMAKPSRDILVKLTELLPESPDNYAFLNEDEASTFGKETFAEMILGVDNLLNTMVALQIAWSLIDASHELRSLILKQMHILLNGRVSSYVSILNKRINFKLKQEGILPENVIIVGHSQGAIMAFAAAFARKKPVLAVIADKGILIPELELPTNQRMPRLVRLLIGGKELENKGPFPEHILQPGIMRLSEHFGAQFKSVIVPDEGHEIGKATRGEIMQAIAEAMQLAK